MVVQATIGTDGGTENTDRILEELPPEKLLDTPSFRLIRGGVACMHSIERSSSTSPTRTPPDSVSKSFDCSTSARQNSANRSSRLLTNYDSISRSFLSVLPVHLYPSYQ